MKLFKLTLAAKTAKQRQKWEPQQILVVHLINSRYSNDIQTYKVKMYETVMEV